MINLKQRTWTQNFQPTVLTISYKYKQYEILFRFSKSGQFENLTPKVKPYCLDRYLHGGGGTDLEKGYGDVRPWRPPFHASPVVRKGPISSKRVSSQDTLLRKFWNFSLYSLNFCQNFSSQAPKFGKFQFTSSGGTHILKWRGCEDTTPKVRVFGDRLNKEKRWSFSEDKRKIGSHLIRTIKEKGSFSEDFSLKKKRGSFREALNLSEKFYLATT